MMFIGLKQELLMELGNIKKDTLKGFALGEFLSGIKLFLETVFEKYDIALSYDFVQDYSIMADNLIHGEKISLINVNTLFNTIEGA